MAHILLVEDEPETCYALAQVMNDAGHALTEADSAASAGRLLAEYKFDLLICELQLAHGQAPAILAEAQRRAPRLGLVAIGGDGLAGSARDMAQATALGAAAILHKPFESETLLAAIERVLDGANRRAAASRNREVARP
jgi:DNA-binding NtrC family response regulator